MRVNTHNRILAVEISMFFPFLVLKDFYLLCVSQIAQMVKVETNLSYIPTGSIASEVDILRVINVWKIHDTK